MKAVATIPIRPLPRVSGHLPCYVLTLDSPWGIRYRSAAGQLARLPLDVTFVPGVRLDAPAESPRYSAWRNRLLMKRPMTGGEVGVYLGHRRIWRLLLAAGHDLALVLEDDFQIGDEEALLDAIADARALPIDWDILKLFDFKPKVPVRRWQADRTEFVAYKYPPSGCVAYLIRASAAARLLARRTIYRPIDEDWSHPWESGLRIISAMPNPVTEAAVDLGGSLLEAERRAAKDLHRSPLRSLHGMLLAVAKNTRASWWRS
ncbi:MAG: glycosyltransferase family 25 protein [Planctomycetia bacterium]|nr:glycosyltransferase family 25 protein [Planctomycetia bacterium]